VPGRIRAPARRNRLGFPAGEDPHVHDPQLDAPVLRAGRVGRALHQRPRLAVAVDGKDVGRQPGLLEVVVHRLRPALESSWLYSALPTSSVWPFTEMV